MKSNKALFITHDSSRSGAPMLVLYLLKWIKSNTKSWSFDVITLEKGPLDNDFENIADHYEIYYNRFISKINYYKKRFLAKKFDFENYYKSVFFETYKKRKYNLIYANTVVSLPLAIEIKEKCKLSIPIICNVHELNAVIESTVPHFERIASQADLFIAGSKLVAQNLIDQYKIPVEKIAVVYDFTDLSCLPTYSERNFLKLTVGAMGATNWRKGNDLFIMIRHLLKRRYPNLNIKFEWIGVQSPFEQIIRDNDILKAEMTSDDITFQTSHENYREFFQNIDILLLTSREDPFPLVAIEAGAYGLPIITFEKATGINEILKEKNGGGFVAPYLDLDAMVDKIIFYYHHRDIMREDGKKNQKIFSDFTVEKSGPEVIKILESFI